MPQGWLNWPSPLPGPPHLPTNLPVRGEDLQAVVAAVDDDDVAVLLDRQTGRAQQLAVAAAGLAPLPQEFAAAVEHRNRVLSSRPTRRHGRWLSTATPNGQVHLPSPSPYSQKSAMCSSSPGPPSCTLLTCIPKLFSLPRLVGIENAVLTETHRLDVIEAGATGGVAPDGMAPIVNSSFRNRCERHSAPPL